MSSEKKYVMINKTNGARIECTEKYLASWLARGFEVEEIKNPTVPNDPDNKAQECMGVEDGLTD
jgi:hypothetical protein